MSRWALAYNKRRDVKITNQASAVHRCYCKGSLILLNILPLVASAAWCKAISNVLLFLTAIRRKCKLRKPLDNKKTEHLIHNNDSNETTEPTKRSKLNLNLTGHAIHSEARLDYRPTSSPDRHCGQPSSTAIKLS